MEISAIAASSSLDLPDPAGLTTVPNQPPPKRRLGGGRHAQNRCCDPQYMRRTRLSRGHSVCRGFGRADQQGGKTQEPLPLRSVYQMLPISAARSQFVPAAPDGDIGTVCPPISTVAFTVNQTAALPIPAGWA